MLGRLDTLFGLNRLSMLSKLDEWGRLPNLPNLHDQNLAKPNHKSYKLTYPGDITYQMWIISADRPNLHNLHKLSDHNITKQKRKSYKLIYIIYI